MAKREIPKFSFSMTEAEWKTLVAFELKLESSDLAIIWRAMKHGRLAVRDKVNNDFGLIDKESALVAERAIAGRKLTPSMLASAIRSGPKLTEILCKYPLSVDKEFVFQTIYDKTFDPNRNDRT